MQFETVCMGCRAALGLLKCVGMQGCDGGVCRGVDALEAEAGRLWQLSFKGGSLHELLVIKSSTRPYPCLIRLNSALKMSGMVAKALAHICNWRVCRILKHSIRILEDPFSSEVSLQFLSALCFLAGYRSHLHSCMGHEHWSLRRPSPRWLGKANIHCTFTETLHALLFSQWYGTRSDLIFLG